MGIYNLRSMFCKIDHCTNMICSQKNVYRPCRVVTVGRYHYMSKGRASFWRIKQNTKIMIPVRSSRYVALITHNVGIGRRMQHHGVDAFLHRLFITPFGYRNNTNTQGQNLRNSFTYRWNIIYSSKNAHNYKLWPPIKISCQFPTAT